MVKYIFTDNKGEIDEFARILTETLIDLLRECYENGSLPMIGDVQEVYKIDNQDNLIIPDNDYDSRFQSVWA